MKISLVQKKSLAKVAGILVVLGLGILLYLPADFFDEGQSVCLSILIADRKCYGCGMTRGIQHLVHGDVSTAWEYNKFAFVVLPLGLFMIFWEIQKTLKATE